MEGRYETKFTNGISVGEADQSLKCQNFTSRKTRRRRNVCETKLKLNLDRFENNFSQETAQLLTETKKK
jgi:hypothetical protein